MRCLFFSKLILSCIAAVLSFYLLPGASLAAPKTKPLPALPLKITYHVTGSLNKEVKRTKFYGCIHDTYTTLSHITGIDYRAQWSIKNVRTTQYAGSSTAKNKASLKGDGGSTSIVNHNLVTCSNNESVNGCLAGYNCDEHIDACQQAGDLRFPPGHVVALRLEPILPGKKNKSWIVTLSKSDPDMGECAHGIVNNSALIESVFTQKFKLIYDGSHKRASFSTKKTSPYSCFEPSAAQGYASYQCAIAPLFEENITFNGPFIVRELDDGIGAPYE